MLKQLEHVISSLVLGKRLCQSSDIILHSLSSPLQPFTDSERSVLVIPKHLHIG